MEPENIQPEIKHKLIKKYKNKKGEEVVKIYDQQKYNSKFYQKHKEKINEIYSSFSDTVISCGTSDCRILIFDSSSFLRSRATLRTVGLGTPSSSTTLL